jgi:apolipoprotein N-acyltransferase
VLGAGSTALLAAVGAHIAGASWIAVWLVLVPWLLSLEGVRSLGAAFASGILVAVLFTLAVLGWLAGAISSYTGASSPLATLVLIVSAPLLQPQLVVVAVARTWLRRRGAGRIHVAVLTASLYVGVEWASGKLLGDTLAHGLHPAAAFRQAADVAGAAGLSFAVVLVSEAMVAAIARAAPRDAASRFGRAATPAAFAIALVASLAGYGRWRLAELGSASAGEPITVATVQAGIADYPRLRAELGTHDAVRLILDAHFELSSGAVSGGDVDLLVWPESVYPTTYGAPKSEAGAAFDQEIATFVSGVGTPLVLGTYALVDGAEFNAAVFLGPGDGPATAVATYRKRRLFPFTERVPAILDHAAARELMPWLGTWQPPESAPSVIGVPLRNGDTLRVAPLVCYDAVDPDLSVAAARQGAELLLVLSNDSWFAHGAGPHQHLIVSAFRSVETGLPQVRATNTGISAEIDASGEILASLGTDERGALLATVPTVRGTRPWALVLVPIVGPAMLLVAAAQLLAGLARRPVH